MDEKTYQDTTTRLQQVNGVITKLDPAIRAEAFGLLKAYITGGQLLSSAIVPARTGTATNGPDAETGPDLTEAEVFFTEHAGGKPSQNAYLSVAYIYSQHGSAPFSIDDVREVANHAGLTLPERVDVTLAGAKKNGKQLFKRAGRGRLQPNVHGETYLKETFGIAKGKKSRAS